MLNADAVSLDKLKLNAKHGGGATPGSFWLRFIAAIIDQMILGFVLFPLNIVLTVLMFALSGNPENPHGSAMVLFYLVYYAVYFLVVFAYFGWFYKNKGATPGKMVFGLRVVKANEGTFIGYGRAFFRETVGKMLSAVILCIGYIMAGFRKDKAALHDLLCETRVIKV